MSGPALPVQTLGAAIVFYGLAVTALPRWQGPPAGAADTTGVHAFWSALDSTWNARDAERFSRFFTDDASFAFVDRGQSLETRATIHRHFSEQFRRQRPDLRHATRVREIRLIAPGIVTVDGEVEIRGTRPDDAAPTVLRRFTITGVMMRTGDEWRIRLLRAYQLSPPPSSQP